MTIRRNHLASVDLDDTIDTVRLDDFDTVVDIRSRRHSHYERSGMDPVSLAVHVWAETGDVPAWDTDLDDDGGWAA